MNTSILGVGRTVSTSVGSGAQVVFAESTSSRDGVLLCNHSSTKRLLVRIWGSYASAPAMTATSHDFAIPPQTTLKIPVTKSAALWVRSEDTTTVDYTGTEYKS